MISAKLLIVLCLGIIVQAQYSLIDNYSGNALFDGFDFAARRPDPTHGYVYYADRTEAFNWGYAYVNANGQAVVRSDDTTIASGLGRGSVRLESKKNYNRGLFIFDVQHMPHGCGTWPALWTVNIPAWPNGGEIDILEGVNNRQFNQYTLHTGPGCSFPNSNPSSCNNPQPSGGNIGCSHYDNDPATYGTQFNNNGGGVYAMQWEASGIYIWFFPRNSIPANIQNNNPNPATWGTPRATFHHGSGCSNSHFYNHKIVVTNTFCGDWAGGEFNNMCGGNCQNFVQNNPSAFSNAYWVFNSIKVYQ